MKQDLSKDICLFGWTSAASPNLKREVAFFGVEQNPQSQTPTEAGDLAQGKLCKLHAGHSVFTFSGLGSSGFPGS